MNTVDCLEAPKVTPAPAFPPSGNESSPNYIGVIARLTPKLRVAVSRDQNQWLLQFRKAPTRWVNEAYCGTKLGLKLRISIYLQYLEARKKIIPLVELLKIYHVPPEAWAAIEALPDYFPKC